MKKLFIYFLFIAITLLEACSVVPPQSQTWTDELKSTEAPKYTKSTRSGVVKDVESIDLWARIREGFDIPDPVTNALIEKHTKQLQANPIYVNRLLERSSSYLFYIIEEVESRDMPSELALLPFVESAFNPKAVSPVKASGMWQFMPATGKSYKLKQNVFIDEREDIIKSTRAALDYLQNLYDMFGDWQLALASYNWGEGNIGRSIKRNEASHLSTDYFSLVMPNETRNYVPKLLAYKRIIENPSKYGFVLPRVPNTPYFVAIPVTRDIDKELVIKLADITEEQFLALNPSFTKPVILSASGPQILLPYGKAEIYQYNLARYSKPLSNYTAVVVGKTESVDKIANSLSLDIAELKALNNIPNGMKIRAGSTLLVRKATNDEQDVPGYILDNGALNLEKEFIPVSVVMKCRGKKCVAAPTNLASYNPLQEKNASKNSKSTPQIATKVNPKDTKKTSVAAHKTVVESTPKDKKKTEKKD